jgi:hypothetical protein
MYKISDFTKPVYKTGEIMEILNISYSTIKVYDKKRNSSDKTDRNRPAGCIQRGPAELSGQ